MNIRIIYHSTTGNTKKLAYAISDTLNVKPESITTNLNLSSGPIDLLFIGDGIYFGKESKKMRYFIEQLDPKIIKNVAVFATYGGVSKIGIYIKNLLINKGIPVIDEPFVCKGKAWGIINKNYPDKNDLIQVSKYAEKMIQKIK